MRAAVVHAFGQPLQIEELPVRELQTHQILVKVVASGARHVVADARYVGRFPFGINFFEMAPIICAGVTVYKGLKETEAKPGQWVAISGTENGHDEDHMPSRQRSVFRSRYEITLVWEHI